MSQIILDHLSIATVSGKDAGNYLQAQLTADLDDLDQGEATFSAYCRPSGKVVAVMLVLKGQHDYRLFASADLMDELLGELGKYILRSDVTFERSDQAVAGIADEGGQELSMVAWPRGTKLGYGVASSREPSGDLQQWRKQELESGITWLNKQTTDMYLPQMLGLESLQGLSFRKGCFPGQEVIARVRYLGKLKRRPLLLQFDADADITVRDPLNLVGEDGEVHGAEVVDLVRMGHHYTVFTVVRAPEDARFSEIEIDGTNVPLKEMAQA